MQGKPHKEPAVPVLLIKGNADALMVIRRDVEIVLLLCVCGQVCDHAFTICLKIVLADSKTEFLALNGFFEVGDQVGNRVPLF